MASQIDGTVPHHNGPLQSYPIRENFSRTKSEIEALQSGKGVTNEISGTSPIHVSNGSGAHATVSLETTIPGAREFSGHVTFNGGTTPAPFDPSSIWTAINSHRIDLDSLDDRVDAITNLGHFVGAFDTHALVPTNTSGFPAGITVNDFINIRQDETHGGLATRHVVSSIAGNGDITWAYDMTYNVDVTGKMDLVAAATAGHLATFGAGGQLTVGVPQATFSTAAAMTTALAAKQNNVAAGTAGFLLTHSGTAGTFGTAIDERRVSRYRGRIDSGTDLNSVMFAGVYSIPTYGIYSSLINLPPQVATQSLTGELHVTGSITETPGASDQLTQRLIVAAASSTGLTRELIRTVYSGGATWAWTAWQEVVYAGHNPIRQGISGTWTEGTEFGGPGLPTAQAFINSTINNRIFSSTIIIQFNQEDTARDLTFHNIFMNRQNTNASTPTYIDLKYSGGQCARRIVVRNCQLPFSIYNEGDPGDVVCENFEMRENSISLGFAATNANHRHIAFTGALSIQHGATVAMNTTGRIDAASFSLGASAIASIAGTLNLTGALNVYGRCEIAAAALLTYASMNIGSQTILTDNRIGGPLNRLGAMVPVTSGGMSFTPTSILDIASRVPVGERHIGTYWSTYSDAPPNFPPSTGGMIKKTLDSAPGTATMNYRITISASAGGLQWWRVVAYTAATNTWAWVVPGDWINQPEWLVNSPNLWPTNGSEVWLADGTFGRRFTGNLVAAAGTDIGTVLTSSLTALTANIVQWGGWFGAGAAATLNKIAVGSASTGAYNSTAHLHLYNSGLGMQTVHNSVARAAPDTGPYDVWVRYTKV